MQVCKKKFENKMIKVVKYVIIITFFISQLIQGSISLVYNIRIAEASKKKALETLKPYTFTFTPTGAYGKTRNDIITGLIGFLQSATYTHNSFFAQFNCAFGETYLIVPPLIALGNTTTIHIKSFYTDDILIKLGYIYSYTDQLSFSFTGHLGLPTHKDYVLQTFPLGYAHVGLGFQFDSQYIYSSPQENAIRSAFRLIQFIPRNAMASLFNQGSTAATNNRFNINLGTLIDIFISHLSIFGNHRLEFGYDQIIFCNGKIRPFLPFALEFFNFISPNFFLAYNYNNSTKYINHILSIGTSLGFTIWPNQFGNKISVEPWMTYIINF